MTIGDRVLGAGVGAGVALVGGQLGPQIGTPEEVATVPAAALIGAIVGFKRIEKFVTSFF